MKIENVLYQAKAIASGGREGRAESLVSPLVLELSTPQELGGAGGTGTNPEELFSMGYSACFLGAMKFVAAKEKMQLPQDMTVTGTVGIGVIPTGFGIRAELEISLPGMDRDRAQMLIDKAHIVCPYSAATRDNIEVELILL